MVTFARSDAAMAGAPTDQGWSSFEELLRTMRDKIS